MLRTFAWIYAIALILFGVLGFVPAATPNGHLLGIFEVDTPHNYIHLISGVFILFAAIASTRAAKIALLWFGIIYTLVLIIGVIQRDTVLGLFVVNTADHWLHAAIALPALWLGFRRT